MGTPLQCQSDDFRLNDYDIKNKQTSHLSSCSAKINEAFFVVLHQMVLMESRAPLRKIALCEGLRDRFEPVIAEAVRAKRVTDTVSGLCVTLSSKASNSR